MTIQEMKEKKQELGYSNQTVAKLSGVPLGTVQKVFGGVTKFPRQQTLEALSAVFDKPSERQPSSVQYSIPSGVRDRVQEEAPSYGSDKHVYSIEDIYALPEGVHAELIDGQIYYMATPTRTHQKLAGGMYLAVANYIKVHNCTCEVYIPRLGVFLNGDESIYLEPDLTVVCDLSKLDEKGCWGAPDWVVEVLSPSTEKKDMGIKAVKYRKAGVKELWMIHPVKRVVIVCLFQEDEEKNEYSIYSFEDEIPSSIFPGLTVKPDDLL